METSIRFNLLTMTIKHRLGMASYKLLSEWLGVYTYVYPIHRKLRIMPIIPVTCARDVLVTYLLCDLIQSTVSEQEQLNYFLTTNNWVKLCS